MSSLGQISQPVPPDIDRGPRLMAMFWTWTGLASMLLTLRFYARYKIHALGWDDWMMLITVVLFIITTCFVTYMSSIGGSRHVYYLSPEQRLEAVKWSWISQPWAIFLFATGKASVAILILRFVGRNTVWRKYILYFIVVTIFIINSLGCILTFAQCNPPRALWVPGIQASCWDPEIQTNFNYFLAAWNIAADIVLALLPATFISKLKLPPTKRIALCALLGLGLVAAIFSGVKVRFLGDLAAREDFTWSAYDIQVWTGAEAFVMMVCGNIPTLQPLWARLGSRKPDISSGRTPLKQYGDSTNGSGPNRTFSAYSGSYQASQVQISEHTTSLPSQHRDKISMTTNFRFTSSPHNFV
ncbi:hypothetical protein AAE478_008740 [Parahypoxylon ruwenzoriense]